MCMIHTVVEKLLDPLCLYVVTYQVLHALFWKRRNICSFVFSDKVSSANAANNLSGWIMVSGRGLPHPYSQMKRGGSSKPPAYAHVIAFITVLVCFLL